MITLVHLVSSTHHLLNSFSINSSSDLLIQSVLVRIFLHPSEVKWFDDFTYEHVTVYGSSRTKVAGCPSFGGLSYGFDHDIDEWKQLSQSFLRRFPSYCVSDFFLSKKINGS